MSAPLLRLRHTPVADSDEVKRWLSLPRPNPKRTTKVVIRRRGDVETRRSMSVLGKTWSVTRTK